MALKPCKECGNQISDKAESCPQCGAKQPKKTSLFTKIVLGLIIFTVILGVIGAMSDDESRQAQEAPSQPKEENKAGVLLFMAQEQIKASAKDPSSVEFRNPQIHQKTKYGAAACGEVNAKNSFGAYTGYKPFVVTEESGGIYMQGNGDSKKFTEVWNEVCTR